MTYIMVTAPKGAHLAREFGTDVMVRARYLNNAVPFFPCRMNVGSGLSWWLAQLGMEIESSQSKPINLWE